MQEIPKYGLDNVALLSPYRQKTETGVNALNDRLQSIVNPQDGKKPEILYRNRIYRMGDKVMQTKTVKTSVMAISDTLRPSQLTIAIVC